MNRSLLSNIGRKVCSRQGISRKVTVELRGEQRTLGGELTVVCENSCGDRMVGRLFWWTKRPLDREGWYRSVGIGSA